MNLKVASARGTAINETTDTNGRDVCTDYCTTPATGIPSGNYCAGGDKKLFWMAKYIDGAGQEVHECVICAQHNFNTQTRCQAMDSCDCTSKELYDGDVNTLCG